MDHATRAAFERLLNLARGDTGQSGRAAAFVLAWWNADKLGGFNLADLFGVDSTIAVDMAQVFSWLAARGMAEYPTAYRAEIEDIMREWRPEIWAPSTEIADVDAV
ncbi:hypothetical protein GCM10011491_41350 [Brucella endophytica]|uniref:DUF7673 domain-containing protein n=1 Tax=Brucella endophytica TaxID=1963359 RepID=A0A916SQW4_9HYPH|nr:hypothetical protein [Brucella endophytica]GGB09125.1 hypothetical protein GCM10011491_41350 [Brucella endophytica]